MTHESPSPTDASVTGGTEPVAAAVHTDPAALLDQLAAEASRATQSEDFSRI